MSEGVTEPLADLRVGRFRIRTFVDAAEAAQWLGPDWEDDLTSTASSPTVNLAAKAGGIGPGSCSDQRVRQAPGAPMGKANGNYRHGRFTSDAIERRRSLNALIRMLGKAAQEVT